MLKLINRITTFFEIKEFNILLKNKNIIIGNDTIFKKNTNYSNSQRF